MSGSFSQPRRPATPKGPRPPESWHLAVVRARETYAELTGDTGPYSAEAAGVILRLAVALWADTAAALGD